MEVMAVSCVDEGRGATSCRVDLARASSLAKVWK